MAQQWHKLANKWRARSPLVSPVTAVPNGDVLCALRCCLFVRLTVEDILDAILSLSLIYNAIDAYIHVLGSVVRTSTLPAIGQSVR